MPALTLNLADSTWGRRLLFALLYMAQGGPIGLIWWYLPTRLRIEGVEVQWIALITSTLLFPWIFKFVWAPMIDTLRGPRFGYRGWIVTMQLLMGLALLPLAFLDAVALPAVAYGLLLAHTLFAATQDVAIDAFALRVTPEAQRGGVTGFMQAGNQAGRWLFGAGVLLVIDYVSPGLIVPVLVGVIWLTTLAVLLAGPGRTTAERTGGRGFVQGLKAVLVRRTTWLGLLFATIGGAGYEAITTLVGPFLIDRGSSAEMNGLFFTVSLPLLLAGGLAASFLTDRLGRRTFTATALVAIAVLVCGFAAYDAFTVEPALRVLFGLLWLIYIAAGAFIAGSYALFMDITDERLGGTQFSAYMGATNLCESWAAMAAGFAVAHVGYGLAFAAMAAASLLALPVINALRPVSPEPAGFPVTPPREIAS